MRPKTSIAGLMRAVLLAALGLTALKLATKWWASLFFTLTVMVVCRSVVTAIERRGPRRTSALGFAAFGVAFLALSMGVLRNSGRDLPYFFFDVLANHHQTLVQPASNPHDVYVDHYSRDYIYIAISLGCLLFAMIGGALGAFLGSRSAGACENLVAEPTVGDNRR